MNTKTFFSAATVAVGMLLTATSCEDENKYESRLPSFDHVSVSPETAAPGDTINGTLYFAYEGSYIKGTYEWDVRNSGSGIIATGKMAAPPVKEMEFRIPVSKDAETGTYTLTVRPSRMAAYAGNPPFIDHNSMGEVTAQLTIATNNQSEE